MHTIDRSANHGRIHPNRRRCGTMLAGLAVLCGASLSAQAATYSVGPGGDGCTHTTLAAALATAAGNPSGPHLIKLRSGAGTDILLASRIEVADQAADLTFQGGYASCNDAAPTTSGVSVIRRDPTGSAQGLLHFNNVVANPRRSVRMERISLRDGVSPGFVGGALGVWGNLTFELGRLSEIRDNQGVTGGGITLNNASADQSTRTELILSHGAVVRDNRTPATGSPSGGGIAGFGNVRVTVQEASFSNNRAQNMGGAIYLTGERARLWLQPTSQLPPVIGFWGFPFISFSGNEAGTRAFNPDAPFNAERGFGGAIALVNGAELWSEGGRSFNRPGIRFADNRANFGGAIHAEGGTGAHSFAVLLNTEVVGNRAYGKGGAFYVKNAMDLRFLSNGAGPCNIGAFIIGFPVDTRQLPCARAIDNIADNEGDSPGFPGGGVVYVTTDDGSSRAIFRSGGALYLDNEDTNGTAAVAAAWRNESKLAFVRSIFDGNRAGGSAVTRAMIDSDSSDVTFFFNTVVGQHPDTSRLFFTGSGAAARLVEAQGSIFWQGVSTAITNEPTAGKVVPGQADQHCLNLHSAHMSELSVTDVGAISNLNPRLDASYAIRPRGEIDACAASRGDVHYPPQFDAWGEPTNVDVPSILNWRGPVDMGAIEQGDIIMYNGFGTYPES